MSKELKALTDSYSDLLVKVLDLQNPGDLLIKVLMSVDETHNQIEQGLLR